MSDSNTSFEQMIDFVEGRLPEAEAQRVAAQIANDPAASNAHDWITNFVSLSQNSTLQAPPATTRAALEDLLPARPTLAVGAQRVLSYVAQLVRDVHVGQAFAGARSAGVGTQRQLFFDIGNGADLSLQLEITTDHVLISGQILAGDPAWRLALAGDDVTAELSADEFGEFSTRVPVTAFLRLDLIAAEHTATIDLTPYLDRSP